MLETWTVGQTIALGVVLVRGATPISAQTPTVEVRRVSDGRYLNWATNNWTMSGGTRELVLPELSYSAGTYRTIWDPTLAGERNEEMYHAIYRNTGIYARLGVDLIRTAHNFLSLAEHNVLREHRFAAVADPTRNVAVGDLDNILVQIKRHVLDAGWADPIAQGVLYLRYETVGGKKVVRKVDGP